MREISFFANQDQLDQLCYALVDRIHELERLLTVGDSAEAYLQFALDETRALSVALKVQIAPQADHDFHADFSR